MWITLEDDFMAVVEEAVKNEPPPPRGHQYEEPDEGQGEEAEAEEEDVQTSNLQRIDLLLTEYEDALKSTGTGTAGQTAAEIYASLQRVLDRFTPSPPTSLGCPAPLPNRAESQSSRRPERRTFLPVLSMDIFLQIASYLSPLELLRCARASKMLRSTLLSSKNRRMWRSALDAVPQLPACPDDMSEPAYAALLFDDCCLVCGVSGAHSVDYALRVRLCQSCWNENVREGADVLEDIPEAAVQLAAVLTPCESNAESMNTGMWWKTEDIEPTQHTKYHFYYVPQLVSVARSLWPPPVVEEWAALKTFIVEHLKRLRRRQVHAILVQYWLAVFAEERDRLFLLQDQQYEELRRSYVSTDLADIQSTKAPAEVRAVTQNAFPLLSRDHESLKARSKQAFDSRHDKRFAQLEEWYEELLAGPWAHFDQQLYPNKHDGGRTASLALCHPRHFDLRSPHTRGEFWNRYTLRALRDGLAFYETNYANLLANLVTAALARRRGEDAERALNAKNDLEATLSMPFALFCCTLCGEAPLPYPEIHVHWREQHMDISVCKPDDAFDDVEPESQSHSGSEAISESEERHHESESEGDLRSPTSSEFREYYAASKQRRFEMRCPYWVELDAEGWEAQQVILDAAGIPEDTWVSDLTQLVSSGRLYCACGNPEIPDPSQLTWADFVLHIAEELYWSSLLQPRGGTNVHEDEVRVLDDHEGFKCIKLLPDGADTSPARHRIRADPDTRARIDAYLAREPQSADILCKICYASIGADVRCELRTLCTADEIVYHLKAKHNKEFEETDIVFETPPPDVLRSG